MTVDFGLSGLPGAVAIDGWKAETERSGREKTARRHRRRRDAVRRKITTTCLRASFLLGVVLSVPAAAPAQERGSGPERPRSRPGRTERGRRRSRLRRPGQPELVALTGVVVVKDSLIMVDFINRQRATHSGVGRMAQQAGGRRTGGR